MLRVGYRALKAAPVQGGRTNALWASRERLVPRQTLAPGLRWSPNARLASGGPLGTATIGASMGKLIGRGSGAAGISQRLKVRVTSRADKAAGKGRPRNPYAIFIAVPAFILGVAFVGVDLVTAATMAEAKDDMLEQLGEDWRDEKVQETIYCFVEESVVPKLVTKVEAALVRGGKLPEPEEGEAGEETRANNRRAAQQYLQEDAKMNPLLSWKAHRSLVAGPGPMAVPMSLEHPLPFSVLFYKEAVNATAPVYVRVNGSNTKPLYLTAHFVREHNYYKLEAVSILDREEQQVSTCVYTHDMSTKLKSMRLAEAFAIAVGPEQTEAPDIELGRQHASYTPVTWWDTPLAKDQSTEFPTKPKGEPVRLVGSQKPKFASLSKLFGEHSFNLQSHLPGLDYLARKARMNELLGSSLSEADTLTRLQNEQCFRGVAQMYMAICKTSQDAYLRSNKIEPGFLECLAEGIRMFASAELVEEGTKHLHEFRSFIRNSRDEGAIVMYDLCAATLLITGHRYQEAADIIEDAAEKIRLLIGEDTPEYGNAMQMAAEAYFSMRDYHNALRCSEAALAIFGAPDFIDMASAYVARIALLSLNKLTEGQDLRDKMAANPIIASALERSPAFFGDLLVRLSVRKAGLPNEHSYTTEVEAAVSEEEGEILVSMANIGAWNKSLCDGLASRKAAKNLNWSQLYQFCQPSVGELLMESDMLNRNGRPYLRTVARLLEDEDVEVAVEGFITMNDEVEVGMTVQVTVNDQEPFWVVVEEEHVRSGVQFHIPLSDLSHPAHVLMEVGRSASSLESSVNAVGVPVPVCFFSTQFGIDDLDKHFMCKALFESKVAPLQQ